MDLANKIKAAEERENQKKEMHWSPESEHKRWINNTTTITRAILISFEFAKIVWQEGKILINKSPFISRDDLYLFSIDTEIGNDYFLTLKNFELWDSANDFCNKLTYLNKCLILNLKK